jgi:hypothetical protein
MIGEHGIELKNKLALLTESEEQVLNVLREDNLKSVIAKKTISGCFRNTVKITRPRISTDRI